jgi:hypothetical protein
MKDPDTVGFLQRSIVVCIPIELRLVQPWINDYERDSLRSRMQDVESASALVELRGEIESHRALRDKQQQEVLDWRHQGSTALDRLKVAQETSAEPVSKDSWWDRRVNYKRAQNELVTTRTELKNLEVKFSQTRSDLLAAVTADSTAHNSERSVISDLATLRELASHPDQKGQTVREVSLFLTLLFTLIECIPVLSKVFSPFDPYDASIQETEFGRILDSLVETRRLFAHASLSD